MVPVLKVPERSLSLEECSSSRLFEDRCIETERDDHGGLSFSFLEGSLDGGVQS
jgi:hypothetical protein